MRGACTSSTSDFIDKLLLNIVMKYMQIWSSPVMYCMEASGLHSHQQLSWGSLTHKD